MKFCHFTQIYLCLGVLRFICIHIMFSLCVENDKDWKIDISLNADSFYKNQVTCESAFALSAYCIMNNDNSGLAWLYTRM